MRGQCKRIHHTSTIITRTRQASQIQLPCSALHQFCSVHNTITQVLQLSHIKRATLEKPQNCHSVADDNSRRCLRWATTHQLKVPRTVGDRAFGVAPALVYGLWNDLPSSVVSVLSLAVFKKNLKTHLFQQWLDSVVVRVTGVDRVGLVIGRSLVRLPVGAQYTPPTPTRLSC